MSFIQEYVSITLLTYPHFYTYSCSYFFLTLYGRTPLIQMLVIRIGLTLRVNLSRIYKIICFEITGYWF